MRNLLLCGVLPVSLANALLEPLLETCEQCHRCDRIGFPCGIETKHCTSREIISITGVAAMRKDMGGRTNHVTPPDQLCYAYSASSYDCCAFSFLRLL